mgnify:CR=1 FL=1
MAVVRVCDYKNCGEQVNEESVDKDFELVSDEGTISITLSPGKDFCQECSRRAKNKLSMLANNALRKPRVKKGES